MTKLIELENVVPTKQELSLVRDIEHRFTHALFWKQAAGEGKIEVIASRRHGQLVCFVTQETREQLG